MVAVRSAGQRSHTSIWYMSSLLELLHLMLHCMSPFFKKKPSSLPPFPPLSPLLFYLAKNPFCQPTLFSETWPPWSSTSVVDLLLVYGSVEISLYLHFIGRNAGLNCDLVCNCHFCHTVVLQLVNFLNIASHTNPCAHTHTHTLYTHTWHHFLLCKGNIAQKFEALHERILVCVYVVVSV